jgi:hypothetical protein
VNPGSYQFIITHFCTYLSPPNQTYVPRNSAIYRELVVTAGEMDDQGKVVVELHLLLTSALVLVSYPIPLRQVTPTAQRYEAGWAPWPVWMLNCRYRKSNRCASVALLVPWPVRCIDRAVQAVQHDVQWRCLDCFFVSSVSQSILMPNYALFPANLL